LIYAIDKINYYICLWKGRLGYAGVFVFDSAVTKIDFEWLDFVELILVRSWLECKVVYVKDLDTGKSELNDK
jgi:hypothetical protein